MKLKFLNFVSFVIGGVGRANISLIPFMATELLFNYSQSGLLRSIFAGSKIILSIPVVFLANKFNNTKLVLYACLIIAFSFLSLYFANGFVFIALAYIVASLGFSMISPIIKAEAVSQTNENNKGRIISNLSTSGELGGLVVATFIGTIATILGWRFSSIALAIFPLIIVVATLFLLKNRSTQEASLREPTKINLSILFEKPKLAMALLSALFDNFASNSIILFLPLLIINRTEENYYVPIVVGALTFGAIVGKYFFGRLSDQYPPANVFIFSEIVMGVLTLLLAFSNSAIFIIITSIILGVFTKGTVPVYGVMTANSVEKSEIKPAFGLEILANNIGALLAPIIFGKVGDLYGINFIFIGFAIMSILATIPATLYKKY